MKLEWRELFRALERLVTFPDSGRAVPEIGKPAIRKIIYGDYRVVYRRSPTRVSIVTVRHGRQRFDATELKRRQD